MEQTATSTHLTDRKSLTILESWEYQYYSHHYECSKEELKSALSEVGNSPEQLRRYFTS